MTTIEKTKIPAALVANAQAVLANGSSSKAKRQEALAVLSKAGVQPARAETGKVDVLKAAAAREAAHKAEIGKAVKGIAVKSLEQERAEANAAVDALDMQAGETVGEFTSRLIGEPAPLTNIHSHKDVAAPEVAPVTADELAAALAIIERATKQQAEAIRKAAAERKKIAPEGEKIKKEKPLTDAQKAKLAKAEAASATYSITCMAAMSFVGKGLGESKKMQTALTVISLPALRWLAKRFEFKIPSDKKSAVLIREFLRVELLTLKPKEA